MWSWNNTGSYIKAYEISNVGFVSIFISQRFGLFHLVCGGFDRFPEEK